MTTLTFNLAELKRISALENIVNFNADDLSQSWLIVDNAAAGLAKRTSLATLESRYQVAGDYLDADDIGVTVQAYNARLADIAGLTPADGAIIVGDGSNFVAESGPTARTSLGLGSAAIADATDFATAAQGALADSAVQPGDLAAVAYSGDYDDLIGSPTLGTLASANWPASDNQEYVAKNGAWAVATGGGTSITLDTIDGILALSPDAGDMFYATDVDKFALYDGSDFRIGSLPMPVRSTSPNIGLDYPMIEDDSPDGYYPDFITNKVIYNSVIGGSDGTTEGGIRLSGGELQVYLNGSWVSIVTNIRIREDDAGGIFLEFRPDGSDIWVNTTNGNSDVLGLNGYPIVWNGKVDIGAYPSPPIVGGRVIS